MEAHVTVVTVGDTPDTPFATTIPEHRLIALWDAPSQPECEELLRYLSTQDFNQRISARPWNTVPQRQAQIHWDSSIKSSIIHGPFPQSILHRAEIANYRTDIRPQAPTPTFNRARHGVKLSPFERRTLWHYSSFVQIVWGSAFLVLPERFMVNANLTWRRLLDFLEAYHVYRGHGWRCLSVAEQRRETKAYALALYESTIWQLSHEHAWVDAPLSETHLVGADILTTRYQAMAHLALATLTHCYLCASQK